MEQTETSKETALSSEKAAYGVGWDSSQQARNGLFPYRRRTLLGIPFFYIHLPKCLGGILQISLLPPTTLGLRKRELKGFT